MKKMQDEYWVAKAGPASDLSKLKVRRLRFPSVGPLFAKLRRGLLACWRCVAAWPRAAPSPRACNPCYCSPRTPT